MITEIDVKILVDEKTLEIKETRLGIAVSSPLTYEAIDYVLYDTFRNLTDRIYDKIQIQKLKEE